MDISKHINDLLYDYDCVIIPGFGGFICSYSPAKINPVQHLFMPPSKKILFNSQLKSNDGLLANHMVTSDFIPYSEAMDKISQFVSDTMHAILRGEKVILVNIGTFYPDARGNIQFDQFVKTNFLKEAFGLAGFVSPPVDRAVRRVKAVRESKRIDRLPVAKPRKLIRIASRALIVMPLLVAAGWIIVSTGLMDSNKNANTSSVVPVNTEVLKDLQFIQPSDITEFLYPKTDELLPDQLPGSDQAITFSDSSVSVPVASPPVIEKGNTFTGTNTPAEPEPVKTVPDHTTALPSNQQAMYYLIAGSFEKMKNAEKLVEEYRSKGYNSHVVGQAPNGYFRVSLAAYTSKSEAAAELRKIREADIPGAWLLKQ